MGGIFGTGSIFDMDYYKAKFKLKGNNWQVGTFSGITCKACGARIEDRCSHNKEKKRRAQ